MYGNFTFVKNIESFIYSLFDLDIKQNEVE